MELELFVALKNEIATKLGDKIKHIALWNNQFYHSNVELDEQAFDYPCVFLEFSQSNFRNLSQGVQQFDITISTHLGFVSFKTDDVEILTIKQELYSVIQRFRNEYFDKLTRVSDRPDYDHDNVQVFVTEYTTTGKDYTKDIRPSVLVTPLLDLSASTISLSGITI
ncbi:MAG: hypothetical protein K0S53_394 [Bacteroidetes bacterium]|jgi:hypothetical protein|nr:hypothetical protein [Bacteroidota bacterium]